jgi:hypothetical protein
VLKRIPFFKILAIGQIALLAKRHLDRLTPAERKRLAGLVRRGFKLNRRERKELRRLAGKLEPRAFAAGAADAFSPLPLPKRRLSGKKQRAG